MYNSRNKILSTLLLVALGIAACLHASAQADSLAFMRKFLQVCNEYKQLPIQLDVEVRNASNLILSGADTGVEKFGFYLCQEGSYIAMGSFEQLANDSLLLLVNKATKRMILMANHQSVAARLRESMGMQTRDSTVDLLAAKYIVTGSPAAGDTSAIELRSRVQLYHTQLPREQVTLRYHATTNQPCEVTTVKRSLVNVSDSMFRAAAVRAEWSGRTVSVNDSSFYLIREQRTVFLYRKVGHEPERSLPVRLSDRVVAESSGRYRPTGSYADFVLSRQF